MSTKMGKVAPDFDSRFGGTEASVDARLLETVSDHKSMPVASTETPRRSVADAEVDVCLDR